MAEIEKIESLIKKFHTDFIKTAKEQKLVKGTKLSEVKSGSGFFVEFVKEINKDNKITRESLASAFFNNSENIISAIDDLSNIIGGGFSNVENLQKNDKKEKAKVEGKVEKKQKQKKKKEPAEDKEDDVDPSVFQKLFARGAEDVSFSDFIPEKEMDRAQEKSKGLFTTLFNGVFSVFKNIAFIVPGVEEAFNTFQSFWSSNLRKALFSPFKAIKFITIRGAQEIVQVVQGTADDLKKIGNVIGKTFGIFFKGLKQFSKTLLKIVGIFGATVKGLISAPKVLSKTFTKIGEGFSFVSKRMSKMGKKSKILAKGLRVIGLAFKFLGGSIKLIVGIIGLVIAAIGFGVFLLVKTIKKNFGVIKEGFNKFIVQPFNKAKEFVVGVIDVISGFFSGIFKGIKTAIKSILPEFLEKRIFGEDNKGKSSDATKSSSSEKESQKKVVAKEKTTSIREIVKLTSVSAPIVNNNKEVVDGLNKLNKTIREKDSGKVKQVSPSPAASIEDLGTVLATRE
jgi:hypothetical protein